MLGLFGKERVLEKVTILVIQADEYDWAAVFESLIPSGGTINHPELKRLGMPVKLEVVQTSWKDIDVGPAENDRFHHGDVYEGRRLRIACPVTVHKRWVGGKPVANHAGGLERPITVVPDFVLVRNEFVTPGSDFRQQLLGLMYADVPSINSLQSILMCADKPVVAGALHRMATTTFRPPPRPTRRVDPAAAPEAAAAAGAAAEEGARSGETKKVFPLLPQSYFASQGSFFYGRTFPAVVKFGSAHAGFGKLRVKHHHDMEDLRTLLPMTKDGYCTAEEFVEGVGDLRLQKLGPHLRAFFRQTTCGAWKTNTQSAVMSEIPVSPDMEAWLNAAAGIFGNDERNRMEILTIDVIVKTSPESEALIAAFAAEAAAAKPGDPKRPRGPPPPPLTMENMKILELNGTSSGFSPDTDAEDNKLLAELVLKKLADAICEPL
eukprot:Hpha_TRINITY_DN10497_c0_g1::TRINITY_DN10497_c0_g1_i1::g.193498::m.193498/K19941/SYN; synapsin